MKDPNRNRAGCVTQAMLQMKKFDAARLEQACGGPTASEDGGRHDHACEKVRV